MTSELERFGSARSAVRRILIVRPGAIGDLLLTLPLLSNLRAHFPAAHLQLLTSPPAISLLTGRCEADTLRSFDSPEFAPLFMDDQPLPAPTREWLAAFDLVFAYIPPGSPVHAQLRRSTGGRVISFDPRLSTQSRLPMRIHLQRALTSLGIEPRRTPSRITLLPGDTAFAAQFWARMAPNPRRSVIALHPGSGSPKKNWPAERFARLADRLIHDEDVQLAIVRGPADTKPVEGMIAHLQSCQPIVLRDLSLAQLAAVLQRCSLLVGNDSGIAHLAAAVGLRGVAIYGPTDPEVWRPVPGFLAVGPASECSPRNDQQRKDCERATCLRSITVEAVHDAVRLQLSQRSS